MRSVCWSGPCSARVPVSLCWPSVIQKRKRKSALRFMGPHWHWPKAFTLLIQQALVPTQQNWTAGFLARLLEYQGHCTECLLSPLKAMTVMYIASKTHLIHDYDTAQNPKVFEGSISNLLVYFTSNTWLRCSQKPKSNLKGPPQNCCCLLHLIHGYDAAQKPKGIWRVHLKFALYLTVCRTHWEQALREIQAAFSRES